MKCFLALVLTGLIASSTLATTPESSSALAAPAVLFVEDEEPPVPDCAALCAALAAAQANYETAQSVELEARAAYFDAADAVWIAMIDVTLWEGWLEDTQEWADDACTNGTPEECQAALDRVNAATGYLADAVAVLQQAEASRDAAASTWAAAKAARDAARAARDAAQAAVDAANCDCSQGGNG